MMPQSLNRVIGLELHDVTDLKFVWSGEDGQPAPCDWLRTT